MLALPPLELPLVAGLSPLIKEPFGVGMILNWDVHPDASSRRTCNDT